MGNLLPRIPHTNLGKGHVENASTAPGQIVVRAFVVMPAKGQIQVPLIVASNGYVQQLLPVGKRSNIAHRISQLCAFPRLDVSYNTG